MNHLICTSMFALTAAYSAPAMADVTAQDVWDRTKTWMQIDPDHPVQVGDLSQSANGITVSNITMQMYEKDITITANIPNIQFIENGDGTVTVNMADTSTVKVNLLDHKHGDVDITLELRQPNSTYTVSGDPDAMAYDIMAPVMELALTEFNTDRTDATIDAAYRINDLNAQYKVTVGGLQKIASSMTIGSIETNMAVQAAANDDGFKLNGQTNDITAIGHVTLPLDINGMSQSDLIKQISYDIDYTLAASNYELAGHWGGMPINAKVTTGSGAFAWQFDPTAMGTNGKIHNVAFDMQSPLTPFPIQFQTQTLNMDILFPMDHRAPSDARLGFGLIKTTLGDGIWNMFDPGQHLPRDPATFDLALSGSLKWAFDLFDPKHEDKLKQAQIPFELNTVQLDRLNIDVAGAQLTGNGAFSFDNRDDARKTALPNPQGQVDLKLVGANGLMDKLVTMGLLNEQDVLGVRMMMAIFTRAGEGKDTVLSTIGLNEHGHGHVMANGQRLQ